MTDVNKKREREKRTVLEMISLYCRKNHHAKKGQMCDECSELAEYASIRSDK